MPAKKKAASRKTTKSPSKRKRKTYYATKAENKYKAGQRGEYKTMAVYENAGFIVVRAAGSKGPADVVAIDSNGQATLVQVKVGKRGISPAEREKLMELKRTHNVNVVIHRWVPYNRTPLAEVL